MRLFYGTVLAAVLCLSGCSARKETAGSRLYNMGERVTVGPLIYTVSETNWMDQLGDANAPRMPQRRFLAIRLSVTNSGTRTSAIPPATLVDANGQAYNELADVEGLPEWLGYLRVLNPAQTEHGKVVFDVPPGSYRLKLLDDADEEEQRSAMVTVPYDTAGVPGSTGR
jgi:hypothetical protein